MHPLKTLSDDTLLDTISEYYDRYRKAIKEGDQRDYMTTSLALRAIHDELNERGIKPKDRFYDEREDFNFTRTHS